MRRAMTRGWRGLAAGAVGLAALGLGPALGCGEEGATTTEEEIERLTTAEDVEIGIEKDAGAAKEGTEGEQPAGEDEQPTGER